MCSVGGDQFSETVGFIDYDQAIQGLADSRPTPAGCQCGRMAGLEIRKLRFIMVHEIHDDQLPHAGVSKSLIVVGIFQTSPHSTPVRSAATIAGWSFPEMTG
jgi:hypothetical protein